jgi:hypothetical protein
MGEQGLPVPLHDRRQGALNGPRRGRLRQLVPGAWIGSAGPPGWAVAAGGLNSRTGRANDTVPVVKWEFAEITVYRDEESEGAEMSKQEMREQTERLIREAMEKKTITVKQGKTRIDAKCGKCGAPNRVLADSGQVRVEYKCKECGREQKTL